MCHGAGRESQLTAGIGGLYYVVVQGASVFHAERRLRITVDLPNSKDKERGEKMRHRWWWAACTEGVYKQPEPSPRTKPAEGSPLWPGGGDTARLTTEVCTQGEDGPGERRRRHDSRDNVPASEGPGCNRDSGRACGLSCTTILDLRRPRANPSASVAQGQGGRDRGQADDF